MLIFKDPWNCGALQIAGPRIHGIMGSSWAAQEAGAAAAGQSGRHQARWGQRDLETTWLGNGVCWKTMENLLVDDYIDREKRGRNTEIGFFRLSPCLPWSWNWLHGSPFFSRGTEEIHGAVHSLATGGASPWDAMGCHKIACESHLILPKKKSSDWNIDPLIISI